MKDWVKIRNISFFLLGLVLWTSLSISVYGSVIVKDLIAYPGQTIERRMGFTNEGEVTIYDVYATPTGDAAGWAQPQVLEFGTVYVGEKTDSQALTIAVPEDAIIGQEYDLIWIFYGWPPDEEEPRDTGGRVHYRIIIVSEPEPEPEPEPETLIDRLIAFLLIPLPFLPVDVPWSSLL